MECKDDDRGLNGKVTYLYDDDNDDRILIEDRTEYRCNTKDLCNAETLWLIHCLPNGGK